MSLARYLANLLNSSGQVPDAKLVALTASKLSGQVPDANAPSGSVIQVVQAVYSGSAVTSTSSTPVATGLSVAITPTSSSSKILVICNPNWAINSSGSNDGTGLGAIYRNSTSIYSLICRVYSYFGASGNYINTGQSLVYLDSPATTSETTYQFYISLQSGSSAQFQGDGQKSSITVLEIAA